MWRYIQVKSQAAIIGNGSQSARIQKILKKKGIKFSVFTRKNLSCLKKVISNDDILYVFICSPNNTHLKYIKQFDKKKFIFCEKPPVNKFSDLKKLKSLYTKNLYFNYNYRFSSIAKIIEQRKKYKLGELLHGNIIVGHGLASKKDYAYSWRSNRRKCPKGVFEIVSIHLIDIINFYFDIKKIDRPQLLNYSNIGNSYDTSFISLKLKNKSKINIFTSYFTPYHEEWSLIFSNGVIKYENNIITIRGPRSTFDKKGFFKKPKIIFRKNISEEKDYNFSLHNSVEYFLNLAKNSKAIPKKLFNKAIQSNSILLM